MTESNTPIYSELKTLILTVPQGQPKAGFLQGLSIIGVQQIDRVVEVVEETLKGLLKLIFD